MSMAEELERLEELRRIGTLSDEEFETAKANLLNPKPAASGGLGLGDTLDQFAADEKQWAMIIHLSQLLAVSGIGLILPIVLWQLKKNTSRLIDQHGRVVTNWIITEVLLAMVVGVASFFLIGIPFAFALVLVGVIFPVVDGIKANKGELWPYPMSYPFFPIDDADSVEDEGWSQGL